MSLPGPFPTPDSPAPFAGEGNRDSVLAEVVTVIAEVIGTEDLEGIEIAPDTAFQEDLEVESIEFVALSEKLIALYGARVDFVAWMASMELDEIIALTVGDLVDFVVTST
jgi:acyl carrier protein